MGLNNLILLLSMVSSVVSTSSHPNVLLIIVDDLRPVLGCYGDQLAITPNIDALARHGMIFTRAFAQQALCGPSRTSFLTSRRPDTTKLYDVHSYWRKHAGNFTTLPQYFKEHGYHTVSAGKVFHPGIVSNHSDDQPYSWSEAAYHPPTQAHKQDPVCLGPDGGLHTNIYCPVQVERQPGGSLPDIETTRYATMWLKKWASGRNDTDEASQRPFFLAVGYHKPHIPLKFPRQFLDFYPIASVPLAPNDRHPPGLPNVAWNPWNDLRWREDIAALNISFPFGPLPDFYARYIRQGYYAATTYTDSLIGDLLSTVNSLFPDTVVALIGDHGWSLGEHQEWSKFSNFEVATRVPFIITRWQQSQTNSPFLGYSSDFHKLREPDLPYKNSRLHLSSTQMENSVRSAENRKFKFLMNEKVTSRVEPGGGCSGRSQRYEGLVELVDLFPTLVDLAGLPIVSSCPENSRDVQVCTEGTSLAPVLKILKNTSNACTSNSIKTGRKVSQQSFPLKTHPEQPPECLLIKKAAFSQYPRPGPEPSVHPDSDQPHVRDTTIMGYSMRTNRYRYTAWLRFNNVTFRPDWDTVIAEELYDHKVDAGENHNVVGKRTYRFKKKHLHQKLKKANPPADETSNGNVCSEADVAAVFSTHYAAATSTSLTEGEYVVHLESYAKGKRIAVGTTDGLVSLLERETLQKVDSFCPHLKQLTGIRFSKDGSLLWTSSTDGLIKMWDARSCNFEKQFPPVTNNTTKVRPLTCFDVSCDERILCGGSEQDEDGAFLMFYDVRSDKVLGSYWQCHTDSITQVKFSPKNPDMLATAAHDALINIFDISKKSEDDALTYCLNAEIPVGKLKWVSNNGQYDRLSAISEMESYQFWDVKESAPKYKFSRTDIALAMKLQDPDDCYLVSADVPVGVVNPILLVGSHDPSGSDCLRTLTLNVRTGELKPHGYFTARQKLLMTRAALYDTGKNSFITGGECGVVRLWNAESQPVVQQSAKHKKKKNQRRGPY